MRLIVTMLLATVTSSLFAGNQRWTEQTIAINIVNLASERKIQLNIPQDVPGCGKSLLIDINDPLRNELYSMALSARRTKSKLSIRFDDASCTITAINDKF